ncbi:hypothetical protein GC177_03610 [bacterium]|nr:hypothetical protein [bacterium]
MSLLSQDVWEHHFKPMFNTWREFVPMVGAVPCSVLPIKEVTKTIADMQGLFHLEGVPQSLNEALETASGFSEDRLKQAIASLAAQWDYYFHAACENLRDTWLQTGLGGDMPEQITERAQRFIEGAYGEPLVFLFLGAFAEACGIYPEDIDVGGLSLADYIAEEHARFDDFASVYHDAHFIFDTDNPEPSRMQARRRFERTAGTFTEFESLRTERDDILLSTFGEAALRSPEQISCRITIPMALEQARAEAQQRFA